MSYCGRKYRPVAIVLKQSVITIPRKALPHPPPPFCLNGESPAILILIIHTNYHYDGPTTQKKYYNGWASLNPLIMDIVWLFFLSPGGRTVT